MRLLRRAAVTAVAASAAITLSAGPSLAHECVNASKNGGAGAQIVFSSTGDVEWISQGLQKRIDAGLVDLDSGEGFHGLIGLDMNDDGTADLTTWIVGPDGEVPEKAQYNGPVCKGVTNIDLYFSQCLQG
jgi:hypothetical protein